MKISKLFVFFIFFFTLPFFTIAQKKDSLYSAKSVGFIQVAKFQSDSISLTFIDSNLMDYQNFNPSFQNRQLNQNLGHYGTANNSLVYNFSQTPGFNLDRTWFNPYLFHFENLKFFRTKSTYTNLRYVSGGKPEQVFEVNLAKNMGRKTDISIDFQRAVSSGNLQLNDIDHLNFAAKVWHQSDSRRYNLLSAFIYNSLLNNENGGLKDDSIFLKPIDIPLEFQPTNISNGKNIFNKREFVLSQFYDFGKFRSIIKDSTTQRIIIPIVRLQYEIKLDDNSTRFTEELPEVSYYKNTSDTLTTYDFQYLKSFSQFFKLHILEKEGRFIYGSLGFKQTMTNYHQNSINYNLTNLSVDNTIGLRISKNIKISNIHSNIFQGNFKNDFSNYTSLQFISNKIGRIEIGLNLRNTSPSLFSQNYYSNHFNWNNNFLNQEYKNLFLNYTESKFKIDLSICRESIENLIYFDNNALPRQFRSTIIIDKFLLKKDFSVYKFHLENTLAVQKANVDTVLALPLFSSYHSIYFERYTFKKVMKLRIGADLRFNTSYFANSYMPALGIYHLQNDIQLGNYPVVDFFVSAYLKRAKIFFKLSHINQGFSQEGYYLTPQYPIGRRAMHVGVSWNFFD